MCLNWNDVIIKTHTTCSLLIFVRLNQKYLQIKYNENKIV